MSKALYRKYRPKKLTEVVGQEQVTEVLAKAMKQGKVSHAYLFVGPRGTGKTSVARIFAHEINGFPYELEDDYVDIIEIDGASNRGIDDIRELREKVAIAPTEGKFKVYIIDEVHMLTTPAFNALLKTLEEPPAHVIFLMATTDVHKVPKTILSRTQVFTFKLADMGTMRKFLREVTEAEGIKIDDAALAIVAERGGGSFRDSLSLLDQVSALSDGEITRDLVISAMGLPEETEISQLLAAYSSRNLDEIARVLREILSAGAKPELLAEGMIKKIIAEPRAEWLGLLARLPEVAAPFPEAKLLVALTEECLAGGSATTGIESSASFASKTTEKGTGQVSFVGGTIREGADSRRTNSETASENMDSRSISSEETSEAREGETNGESSEKESEKANKAADSSLSGEGNERTSGEISDTADGGAFPFDWSAYKIKVSEQNDAIAQQLDKVDYELKSGVLHLYPKLKVTRNILKREKNLAILAGAAGSWQVKLHEFGEVPEHKNAEIDAKLARLSDIMGGEVVEDEGESPF